MGKRLQARRQFVCCEKLEKAVIKKKSGLIVSNEKSNDFSYYKIVNVGEEIADQYKVGAVILVDDSHVNLVPFEDTMYYIVDDAFIPAEVLED